MMDFMRQLLSEPWLHGLFAIVAVLIAFAGLFKGFNWYRQSIGGGRGGNAEVTGERGEAYGGEGGRGGGRFGPGGDGGNAKVTSKRGKAAGGKGGDAL